MGMSDWIALGALAIAALAFFDSRKTRKEARADREAARKRTAVQFELTRRNVIDNKHIFVARNIGTERVQGASVDVSKLARWAVSGFPTFAALEPGEFSDIFRIESMSDDLPETVTITWTLPFPGSQVVLVPALQQSDGSQ